MEKRHPKEIFVLMICYMLGIYVDVQLVYGLITRGKSVIEIVLISLPSLLLITMIFLLFVRKDWAYKTLWILYIPIALCGFITAIVNVFLDIFITALMLVCGLTTLNLMLCPTFKNYYADSNNPTAS